nr:MAG TPA: hypothetical protein [Caudoviricetes sp.]
MLRAVDGVVCHADTCRSAKFSVQKTKSNFLNNSKQIVQIFFRSAFQKTNLNFQYFFMSFAAHSFVFRRIRNNDHAQIVQITEVKGRKILNFCIVFGQETGNGNSQVYHFAHFTTAMIRFPIAPSIAMTAAARADIIVFCISAAGRQGGVWCWRSSKCILTIPRNSAISRRAWLTSCQRSRLSGGSGIFCSNLFGMDSTG